MWRWGELKPDGHKFANAHKCRGSRLVCFGIRNSRNMTPASSILPRVKQFTRSHLH